jgi:hypothetical protein
MLLIFTFGKIAFLYTRQMLRMSGEISGLDDGEHKNYCFLG